MPQHSIDISYSNGSSNPVTPEDREPITAVKRSTSFHNLNSFNRRHRNTLDSPLYPSSSSTLFPTNVNTITTTTTTINTNNSNHLDQSNNLPISRYLPQNQAVITTQDNWRISLSNQIAVNILSGSKRIQHQDHFIGKHILDFIDVTHRPLLLAKIVKRRQDHNHSNLNGTVLICGDIVSYFFLYIECVYLFYFIDTHCETRWYKIICFTLVKRKEKRNWHLHLYLDH